MRVLNVEGRASVQVPGGYVDVEEITGGAFGPDPMTVYADWDGFRAAVESATRQAQVRPLDPATLRAPIPLPRQIFAIGLNYRDHAAEAGLPLPTRPVVFTKFVTCLTGPYSPVPLPTDGVDYETELVAVIGRRAERVSAAEGWAHVAGLTAGQDLSEREVQRFGPAAQFALGKSFPGFGPIGPAVVTIDELSDPDDLAIGCRIGDEVLQDGRTKDLIFTVPQLVARLSAICPLLPGDLIFTGTCAGVGLSHTPPRFLRPGETLVTEVEGIGRLENPLVAGPTYVPED